MPLPLPPRFLREAEKEKNSPFMLLAIDSRGQSDEITSEADWGTATSESNVDYTPTPPNTGDVISAVDTGTTNSVSDKAAPTDNAVNTFTTGAYTDVDEWPTANDADYLRYALNTSPGTPEAHTKSHEGTLLASDLTTILNALPDNVFIRDVRVLCRNRYALAVGTLTYARTNGGIRIGGTTYWSTAVDITTSFADYYFSWTTNPDTGVAWLKSDILTLQRVGTQALLSVGGDSQSTNDCSQYYLEVRWYNFQATGSITVPLDLGAAANTDNDATVTIDDNVPTGAGLTYTLLGSDTGAFAGEETDLGTVEDGSRVQGFRYYHPTGDFTSDGTVTAVAKSIKIEIPDNVYRFTTLPGNALTALSTLDALPLVTTLPGRTIEIDLKSFITKTSNMTVNLSRTDFVDEMVRGNYFRGLAVDIKLGMLFDGVTEDDMIPYYQGRITDYQLTPRELRIEVQDASKDLSAKWPIGTAPASPPIQAYSSPTHMVDVINEIIDDIGIKTRYVDRGSLDSVKANVGTAVAASNYVVFRGVDGATDTTIKDSEPAKDYITELLQLLGTYLVIPENGKLTVVLYDASTASQETWDEDVYDKDANFRAGLKGLKNVTDLFYDGTGDGEALKNFGSIYITADSTSMADWDITAIKKIVSLWLAGDSTTGYYGTELATEITDRETTRLKDGLGLFNCKTSLVKAGFQVGEFIDIDSDTIIKPDIGVGDTQKFMIIKKTWEAASNYVSWILMEAR